MCINVSHTLRHTRTPNTDLTHIDSSHTDNMTFHALIVFYIFERCVGDVLNSAPPAAVARALRALSPVIFAHPAQPQNGHWKTMQRFVCFSFIKKKEKKRSEADVQPLNYAEAGHLHSLGDTWLLLPQNQSTENRINLVTIAQTFLLRHIIHIRKHMQTENLQKKKKKVILQAPSNQSNVSHQGAHFS